MDNTYVLSYDLGTSSVKGALVLPDGRVSATATCPYPLYRPAPDQAEQNPEDYWQGVCRVTRQLLSDTGISPAAVAGMAFGTQWRGIIPIHSRGEVLHNCLIWLDGRAGAQAEAMNRRFPGVAMTPSSYWPKLMWLRENRPELLAQSAMILEINAFLKWKATGVATVDISNCFTAAFDPERDRFFRELVAFAGVDGALFPPLVRSQEQVGRLTEQAALAMGLGPGIPVFGGNNDIQAVAVGSGCSDIGDTHVYFGTSGWIGTVVPHQKNLLGSGFDEGRDIRMYGTKAVGLALNWVIDRYYAQEKEALGDGVYDLIARDVREVPPGSDGIQALPGIFRGLRPQVEFRGVKAGHDRRYLVRALMESVCCYLAQVYFTGCPEENRAKVMHGVGGGACSGEWMQMLADILGVTVRVPDAPRHVGAVGTAISALVGLGVFQSFEDARARRKIQKTYVPNEALRQVYRETLERYGQLMAQ